MMFEIKNITNEELYKIFVEQTKKVYNKFYEKFYVDYEIMRYDTGRLIFRRIYNETEINVEETIANWFDGNKKYGDYVCINVFGNGVEFIIFKDICNEFDEENDDETN